MILRSNQCRYLLQTITLYLACFPIVTESLCNLCEAGVTGIMWPSHDLNGFRHTCTDEAIRLAQLNEVTDWELCQDGIDLNRNICCGPDEPDPVNLGSPAPAPTVQYNHFGDYDVCQICYDDKPPGITSMVISVLYLGSGSCTQFYGYGQQGQIPEYLCDTIRFFAEEPCGCGVYNPNNSGTDPDPAPDAEDDNEAGSGETDSDTGATGIRTRRKPNIENDKASFKLSNNRGGQGGTRRLKGQKRLSI